MVGMTPLPNTSQLNISQYGTVDDAIVKKSENTPFVPIGGVQYSQTDLSVNTPSPAYVPTKAEIDTFTPFMQEIAAAQ
jgi:hypothetical protein